jgi:hypothetical protein
MSWATAGTGCAPYVTINIAPAAAFEINFESMFLPAEAALNYSSFRDKMQADG